MTVRTLAVTALSLLALAGAACEKKPADPAAADKAAGSGGTFEAIRDKAAKTLKDGLDAAKVKIDQLSEKAKTAAEPVKQAVQPLLDDAKKQAGAIGDQIEELRKAGASQWQSISEAIKQKAAALAKSLQEAGQKLGG